MRIHAATPRARKFFAVSRSFTRFLRRIIELAGIRIWSAATMNDAERLRHYVATGSEDAFAALVHRYLPLVYAAALRRVGGDAHRAQDVAQLVFTAFARNARALVRHPDPTGWLFITTRFLAAKTIRSERRRQSREHAAGSGPEVMHEDTPKESSAPLHTVLDDVLTELRQIDRQVILLRFYRGVRLAEIAEQLDATENAVQKRIDRALDQLRQRLARRGITSTAAALAVAFEQHAVIATPAGLAAAVTSAGLACGSGAAGWLVVSGLMTVSKLQLGVAAAAVACVSAALVWQVQENAGLRADAANQISASVARTAELRQQLNVLTQSAAAAEADGALLQGALQAAASAPTAPRAGILTNVREQARAASARASKLTQEGKFQEALEEYLRCYRDLASKERAQFEQQLVMNGIQSLGRRYPPAVAALRELRDTAMQKLQAKPGERDLVTEIALLNDRLGDGHASMLLYDTLPPGDPGRQAIGTIARNAFVAARRYADALVGTPFGSMMNELEMGIRHSAGQAGQSLAAHRGFVVNRTATNIEVLIGAGRIEEARMLSEKLLAYDGSEATREAIRQRVERASQP
jgi:RNA polymerase sigma factor (sigma-70 family)